MEDLFLPPPGHWLVTPPFCSGGGEALRGILAQNLKKARRHRSPPQGGRSLTRRRVPHNAGLPFACCSGMAPWLHPDPRQTRECHSAWSLESGPWSATGAWSLECSSREHSTVLQGPQRAPEMLTRPLYILEGGSGASQGFPEKEPTRSQMAHSSWAGGPFLSVNLLSRTVVWGRGLEGRTRPPPVYTSLTFSDPPICLLDVRAC